MGKRLTERDLILLRECDRHSISDVGKVYYRLGGYGTIPLRYHPDTIPTLIRAGLIDRSRGYYKITDLGRSALTQATRTEQTGE